MKKTLVFLMVVVSTTTYSQQLPEFTLKNDLLYFSYDKIKATNTKKCLATYPISWSSPKIDEIEQKHQKSKHLYFGDIKIDLHEKGGHRKLKCKDTLILSGFIRFPDKKNIAQITGISSLPGAIIRKNTKQLTTQVINFIGEIQFLSNNEYKIIFKGFTLVSNYLEKGKSSVEETPLGKIYNEAKAKNPVPKDQINFFNEFNTIIQEINAMLNESIKEAYEVGDL